MRKMFKTRLALLLAATLLAAGTFTSCSDGGESSSDQSAVETLPEVSGIDPFKNGYYSLKDRGRWGLFGSIVEDEEDEDPYYDKLFYVSDDWFIKLDTSARTMELLDEDKAIHDGSVQFKYTYNETKQTVTLALSKVAAPKDISKYIDYIIKDDDYDEGYKLVSLSEYKKYLDTVCSNKDYRNWWMSDGSTLEELTEVLKQHKSEYENAFETPLVYKYTVNDDESISLELTDPEPVDENQSTTLQFVE